MDTKNTEYKAEPVWHSALSACGAKYLIASHGLSSLDFKILRVVAAAVISESDFQSCTLAEHILADFKPNVTHQYT